jgi:hypothetical protein
MDAKEEVSASLQKATLDAIRGIVESTNQQVSYSVFNSVDGDFLGKNKTVKTHINITITEGRIDTMPKGI